MHRANLSPPVDVYSGKKSHLTVLQCKDLLRPGKLWPVWLPHLFGLCQTARRRGNRGRLVLCQACITPEGKPFHA